MKQRRCETDGDLPSDLPSDLHRAQWKRRFRRRLLGWFSKNARDLPWRRTRDPYHVWVSEVMLQQTQVVTVIAHFERFIEQFPTIERLAEASEQEVLRRWEGLGYYRRARQLHLAAQQVVKQHGGEFPTNIEQVRALPGIGRYTAGAVLSIALGQRHPIVEANTTRVLSRLVAFRGNPTRSAGQRLLWTVAEALLPRSRPGDFNQAMMELGSEICVPRQPPCRQCPVMDQCLTFVRGLQDEIPRPKEKMRVTHLREAAVVIRRNGHVLVRQCQPGERWAGLWDFPRFEVNEAGGEKLDQELTRKVAEMTGLTVVLTQQLATFQHSVTRYRITLLCHEASCSRRSKSTDQHCWVELGDLATLPLSVTGRKISRLLCLSASRN